MGYHMFEKKSEAEDAALEFCEAQIKAGCAVKIDFERKGLAVVDHEAVTVVTRWGTPRPGGLYPATIDRFLWPAE